VTVTRPPVPPTAALALVLALAAGACRCAEKPADPPPPAPAVKAFVPQATCPVERPGRHASVAGSGDEAPDEALDDDDLRLAAALAAFDRAFDGERWEEALACAQEAARADPAEPAAHVDRGAALDALERPDEARDAYERAVALDPENPDALRAMADFLLRQGGDDGLEAAAMLARRGREHTNDASLGADLAALEASADNALGHSSEALVAAETALTLSGDLANAYVERGIALFELIRFDEARAALEQARTVAAADAKAAYFLGLLREREHRDAEAAALFAEATKSDPDTYPAALPLDPPAFDALVAAEIAKLPPEKQAALKTTDFHWVEMPETDDLQKGEPVLSPTIVGLFRPGEDGGRDAIFVYRRNLLRLCRSEAELHDEVRDTLLHELGHLDGEDDAELRDRGL
jgi:tetratricopeptide (TPR) repeat protein